MAQPVQLQLTLISTGQTDPMAMLIRELFGVQTVYTEPGTCVLQLSTGTLIHLCNCGAQPPAYLSKAPQPVLSLAVPNLETAIDRAEQLGAKLAEMEGRRCYLQWPDGRILGLWQELISPA